MAVDRILIVLLRDQGMLRRSDARYCVTEPSRDSILASRHIVECRDEPYSESEISLISMAQSHEVCRLALWTTIRAWFLLK